MRAAAVETRNTLAVSISQQLIASCGLLRRCEDMGVVYEVFGEGQVGLDVSLTPSECSKSIEFILRLRLCRLSAHEAIGEFRQLLLGNGINTDGVYDVLQNTSDAIARVRLRRRSSGNSVSDASNTRRSGTASWGRCPANRRTRTAPSTSSETNRT